MAVNRLKGSALKPQQKGQALFEFIVFLPFLLFMLTIMFTVGNAINGSINQQKAVRRYFFHFYKGNSTLPMARDLNYFSEQGLRRVGAVSVGWREKSSKSGEIGDSFATCYRFSRLFGESDDDDCFNPSINEGRSNFIRIYTQFGLCGETYALSNENNTISPDYFGRARSYGCTIQ